MDRLTLAKVALVIVGVGVFAFGVRGENTVVRWVGIALVIVAFLLRFVKRRNVE